MLQISLGAACLIGTYWGVTRFLAGDFEPAFANVQPTFRGASATGSASGVLASTTQVRATEMPEIIGGVPELMPVKVSASTRTDQPKPAPTVIRNFPEKSISSAGKKVEGLAALDPISGTQPAASHGESSSDQLRSHEERAASGPPAQNSASVVTVPEVPTGAPAITSGSSEPSVTSPLPQVASTALNSDSAKEIVSRGHREDAESAKVSAALPGQRADREAEETAKVTARTIMPPNRTDA
ncbi:MAG: hypothetical protein K0S06_486, partial [Microvirga sp.]|nr:hypothetical protein [Microvirga sp.]